MPLLFCSCLIQDLLGIWLIAVHGCVVLAISYRSFTMIGGGHQFPVLVGVVFQVFHGGSQNPWHQVRRALVAAAGLPTCSQLRVCVIARCGGAKFVFSSAHPKALVPINILGLDPSVHAHSTLKFGCAGLVRCKGA